VGNAAVLVNPENVFEIMRALHRVLLDQTLRERMKQRGYDQAKKFSWDASAREILNVYEQVTGQRDERVRSRNDDEESLPKVANT
jgi:glycosyltransferase involved in cell wall biosynthesis